MKSQMFDKNDDQILYEHEFPIILKCEKCGKSEKSSVYFSNHIPSAKAAFKYEFGTKKDQKGKYWWECDCGGSMYVTKKFIEDDEEDDEDEIDAYDKLIEHHPFEY